MQRRLLALIPVAALLVAACSSSGGSPGAPSIEPSTAPAPTSEAQTRIDVSLTDQLKIEPAGMTVPAGVPVTFVVTNSGGIDHEFVLGDEAAQAEHEEEMMAGGMQHDESDAIVVKPGETKELTFTFATPGETLAGCHVTGHYAAGMKAIINVTQ
jgi:uncharacterized cupredoxin-like copper-binding protein